MISGRIDKTSFQLTLEDWAEINQGSDWPTFIRLICVILLTFVAILLAINLFESLWIAIVVFPLSVSLFNQLAQVTHFASHGALVPSRRIEILVGRLTSASLGYTFDGFSRTHQNHHAYLNGPNDGDRLWAVEEITRRRLLRVVFADLFGISAVSRGIQYYFGSRQQNPKLAASASDADRAITLRTNGMNVLQVMLTQSVILAIFHAVRGWEFYFLFYVLPLITLYPLQARLRSVCEHLPPRSTEGVNYWFARTFDLNFFERFVLGPSQQNYHLEHHLVPNASPRKLRKIRAVLESRHDLKTVKARSYLSLGWQILWVQTRSFAPDAQIAPQRSADKTQ